MNQFHSLKIREVRPETREAVSIAFDIPSELADAFRFTQGQHLIVRTHMDGEEVRRSYSICTGVNDRDLRVAVKKVPGGRFSGFANGELKEGDKRIRLTEAELQLLTVLAGSPGEPVR